MKTTQPLSSVDPAIAAILASEEKRQEEGLELIALELARLEQAEGSAKWRMLGKELDRRLKANAKRLLGGLWTFSSSSSFTWRLGFIREARLWTRQSVLAQPSGRRMPKPRVNKMLKMTDELLRLDSAALLEHLTLGSTYNAQLFLWDACARVSEGAPATLHRLDLRDLYEGELPDWEPDRRLELLWRGRVMTLGSDSLALESAAELFG